MNLLFLLLAPVIAILIIAFLKKPSLIKVTALIGSSVQLIMVIFYIVSYVMYRKYGFTNMFLFESSYSWFPALHIYLKTGVDGISLAMIILTAMVVVAGILVSWKIEYRVKDFFILILLLSLGAYGFFISTDLFAMFFFLELAVIPKFLLISIWGSGKKEYSAMKLVLMLMGGSALVFLGITALYHFSGSYMTGHTWDLQQLSSINLPINIQRVLYLLLFTGFGVFTALFPFHTWAPDGHSSAPTAASMFLAGISMKLGGYGCLRVATYLLPDAAKELSWIFIILAAIAILYGAIVTMMQSDLKYMNAYSSVSHCGFVVLGIAMLTKAAIIGAVVQMVSHGVMTALFFASIGMLYDRTHTRQINQLGGVLKQMPYIGSLFMIVGLCSLGLPGLSGFVAEMTVFVGSWERIGLFYRIAVILSAASIVVTAVYILRAIGTAIWGVVTNKEYLQLADAGWAEKTASILLIVGIVLIGVFPFVIIHILGNDAQTIVNALNK